MTKTIVFYPTSKDILGVVPPPAPAISENIPEWIRKVPKYKFNHTSFDVINGDNNLTSRHCIPMLEGFTSGYVMTTHIDLLVEIDDLGNHVIKWIENSIPAYSPVRLRPSYESSPENYPVGVFEGYERLQFNWVPSWSIKTPKGYSSIFTHPINRIDLPFYTLGGVIDTDGWSEAGNQPFVFKKGWTGVIPKGTPFVQVIPFKRENWSSLTDVESTSTHVANLRKRDSVLRGWYKKNAWVTKRYR